MNVSPPLTSAEIQTLFADLGVTQYQTKNEEETRSLDALNELAYAFHQRLPFQNLTLLAKDAGSQGVPSWAEMKDDVTSLRGGLCYTSNVFMKELLGCLGYDVYHAAATCNQAHPNNHILTIVNGLPRATENGGLTAVDVGFGYPTYQAVPLDFEVESPAYKSGFLSYKLIHNGHLDYRREQSVAWKRGCISLQNSMTSDGWERVYSFSVTPRDLSYFKPAMSEVYEDRFLRKLRVIRFSGSTMHALKEYKNGAVYIRVGDHDGTMETPLVTNEEIYNCILGHMDVNISADNVRRALRNWRIFSQAGKS